MPKKSAEISGGWPEKIVGGDLNVGGSKILGGVDPSQKVCQKGRKL